MKANSFPTFRRAGRFALRCLRKVFFSRRSAVVYIVLVTLAWLGISVDRWIGRRAWAAEKERLAAAGESLDLRDLLPQRPPDERNFFAIPALNGTGKSDSQETREYRARLAMWFRHSTVEVTRRNGLTSKQPAQYPPLAADTPLQAWCDVFRKTGALPLQPLDADPARELLLSAAQWRDIFDALYAATNRPGAVFIPTTLERGGSDAGLMTGNGSIMLAHSFMLHGLAAVATGDFATSLADMDVLAKLEQGNANESDIWGVSGAGYQLRFQLEILRSGMKTHGWTAAQLEHIAKRSDIAGDLSRIRTAIAIERTQVCSRWEKCEPAKLQFITVGAGMPLGMWIKVAYARLSPEGPVLRYCAALSEAHSRIISGLLPPEPSDGWAARMHALDHKGFPHLFANWFGHGIMPSFHRGWCNRRFMDIACALERHYLTHRAYPPAISALTTAPVPAAWLDTDGQPLRYSVSADGSAFRIWSIGWNRKDDSTAAKGSDDIVFSTE